MTKNEELSKKYEAFRVAFDLAKSESFLPTLDRGNFKSGFLMGYDAGFRAAVGVMNSDSAENEEDKYEEMTGMRPPHGVWADWLSTQKEGDVTQERGGE